MFYWDHSSSRHMTNGNLYSLFALLTASAYKILAS